jgi:hypothetical protein
VSIGLFWTSHAWFELLEWHMVSSENDLLLCWALLQPSRSLERVRGYKIRLEVCEVDVGPSFSQIYVQLRFWKKKKAPACHPAVSLTTSLSVFSRVPWTSTEGPSINFPRLLNFLIRLLSAPMITEGRCVHWTGICISGSEGIEHVFQLAGC